MMEKYTYGRLRSLVRHLASVRGALLGLSVIAALIAYLSSDGLQTVAFVISVASAAMLALVTSLRLSDQYRKSRDLTRQVRGLTEQVRMVKTPEPRAYAKPGRRDFGFDQTKQAEDRLARNRQKLVLARAELVIGGVAASVDTIDSEESEPIHHDGVVVTIVVPCFNQEIHLTETLESIRRQSFADWECIIVDDASTDGSVSEAWRYVSIDSRFRLIRQKSNEGLSATRNTGLRLATGTFVTFVDADDMLLEDSLMDRLEAISQADQKDLAGSFCGVKHVGENALIEGRPPHEPWSSSDFVDFVSAGGEAPFSVHAALIRTELVRAVGGFEESMRDGAEDWDLWLRIMRNGYFFAASRYATALYRQRADSMAKTEAVAHVKESARLTHASYEPAASGVLSIPASYPFPEPVAYYRELLSIARRRVQFAAIAFIRGDRESSERILSDLDRSCLPLLERHVDIGHAIRVGFARGLGMSAGELTALAEDVQPLVDELASAVRVATSAPSIVDVADDVRTVDILFCPQTGYQASAMLEIANSLTPEFRVAFLMVGSVAGNQGVATVLSGSSVESFSLNEWTLGRIRYRQLVTAFPRAGAVEEVIAATSRAGGRVVDLVLGAEEVMMVADTPSYGHDTARLNPSEYLEKTASGDIGTAEAVIPAVGRIGGLPWTGLVDPNPDNAFRIEEQPQRIADSTQMEAFRDRHLGDRCVIIGNGPSLNDLDLTKIANEYTIGVNGIFYASEDMGFDLTYYVVEDTMVVADNLDAIKAYRAGHKFFPSIYRDQIGEAADVTYFTMNGGYYARRSPAYCVPRFSTDAAQRLYSGQSVTTINLQLAYYLGFSEVILIGMDFSYTVPSDSEIDGNHILSVGDDPNHFHPDYFGKGKTWKDPKLDRVLANYQLAKLMYEADGRRIVNATPGGKLELFERVPFDDLFGA